MKVGSSLVSNVGEYDNSSETFETVMEVTDRGSMVDLTQSSGLGSSEATIAVKDVQDYVRNEVQAVLSKFAEALCTQMEKSNFSQSNEIVKSMKLAEAQFLRSMRVVVTIGNE